MKIEHEADEDTAINEYGDNGDNQSFDESSIAESLTTPSGESAQLKHFPSNSQPEKVFVAGRRRSDTFCNPERCMRSANNSPDDAYGKTGCADVFCISNHRKARRSTPQQQKEQERVEIQEYFGNCASMDSRPSTAMSAPSRESRPQSNPNGALQLIREISTTPTKRNPFQIPATPPTPTAPLPPPRPHIFEISSKHAARKSTKPNTFSRLPNGQTSFPRPRSRTSTPDLRKRQSTPTSIKSVSTESIETTASKKSIRKNITVFFSDLIPFSKTRRKRVLPLPVK